MLLSHLAPLLLLLPAAQGLELRAPTVLATGLGPHTPSHLASDPDRVAFAWRDSTDGGVLATWSDGRGIEWTTPLGIDLAPPGSEVKRFQLALAGDFLLVQWDDNRFHPIPSVSAPQSTPFLRRLDLTTGQVGPELALPTFGSPGNTETRVHAWATAEVGGAQHVHLLLSTLRFNPARLEWRMLSSHDGGESFPFLLELELNDILLAFRAALSVEGPAVHVVLVRNDAQQAQGSLAHFRSVDGGVSLDPTAASPLSATTTSFYGAPAIHRAGGALTVAWTRSWVDPVTFQNQFRVEAISSGDGGDNFGATETLASASSFNQLIVDEVLELPASDTRVVAWRRNNVDANQTNFFVSCQPGQGAWSSTQLTGSAPLFTQASWAGFAGDPEGRSRLLAVWSTQDLFFPSFSASSLRLSRDGGLTWSAQQAAAPMGEVVHHATFDPTYQNGVWLTRTATEWLAGGGRAQALQPSGFVAGPTQIGAQFQGFDGGSPLAWMLVSTSPGALHLPDGRNLGLSMDPLLMLSLNLAIGGAFAAPLNTTGQGQLAPLPVDLPPGASLHLVGLSFDPITFAPLDLSDVVRVDF